MSKSGPGQRQAIESEDIRAEAGSLIGPAQVRFYETFGFLHLPGLFAAEVERIENGFDEVFAGNGPRLALDPDDAYHHLRADREVEKARTIIPAFIDQSDDLAWIRTDRRILDIVDALLGADARYAESDGNRINCDVRWHTDVYGVADNAPHLKLFFYLETLDAETGALRVLPGSHTEGAFAAEVHRTVNDLSELPNHWGCTYDDVPSFVIDVEPGDLIMMNFRTVHASIGGRPGRRLFTVNFAAAID